MDEKLQTPTLANRSILIETQQTRCVTMISDDNLMCNHVDENLA